MIETLTKTLTERFDVSEILLKSKKSGKAQYLYRAVLERLYGASEALEHCLCSKRQLLYAKNIVLEKDVLELLSLVQLTTVADGVTVQPLSPDYYNEELMKQPVVIYRMDNKGKRFYYTKEEDTPIFYDSVTSFIRNSLPTSPELLKWMVNTFSTMSEHQSFMDEKAHYGTFLHLKCGEVAMKGFYDLNKLKQDLISYSETHFLPPTFLMHETALKHDLMAWAKFLIVHDVKVVAVEMLLANKEMQTAGAIDFIFEMNISDTYKGGAKQGLPKGEERGFAILDVKSGRKGFFDAHALQLHTYLLMWNAQYPDMPISKLYNWAPTDWRGAPKWKLKDQKDHPIKDTLPTLLELNKSKRHPSTLTVTKLSGLISLKEGKWGEVTTSNIATFV